MIGIFPVSYRVFEIGNANTAATKAIISTKQKGGVLNSVQPELFMKSRLHPKSRDGILNFPLSTCKGGFWLSALSIPTHPRQTCSGKRRRVLMAREMMGSTVSKRI